MVTHDDMTLYAVEKGDADLILHWRNRPHVHRHMYSDHTITKEEHHAWIETITSDDDSTDYFIAYYRDTPVGLCGLYQIESQNRRCKWGFYIGDETAPKGCGRMMLSQLADVAFFDHPMRTVFSEIIQGNMASIKVHQALGFTLGDIMPQYVVKEGESKDVIIMTLKKTDWLENPHRLEAVV